MTSVLTAKGEKFEVAGSSFCDIANCRYDDQMKQGAALTKRHDTTRGLRGSSGEKVISVCRCIDLGVSPLSVGRRDKRRGPPCRQFATRPWSIKLWTGRFICLDRAILEHSHTLTHTKQRLKGQHSETSLLKSQTGIPLITQRSLSLISVSVSL